MTRTILRRISNLKDIKVLAREEAEKAVRIEGTSRSLDEGPSIAIYKPIDIVSRHYLGL